MLGYSVSGRHLRLVVYLTELQPNERTHADFEAEYAEFESNMTPIPDDVQAFIDTGNPMVIDPQEEEKVTRPMRRE